MWIMKLKKEENTLVWNNILVHQIKNQGDNFVQFLNFLLHCSPLVDSLNKMAFETYFIMHKWRHLVVLDVVINYVITHWMPTYNWLETAVHDQHVGFKIQFNSTGGDNSTKFN